MKEWQIGALMIIGTLVIVALGWWAFIAWWPEGLFINGTGRV